MWKRHQIEKKIGTGHEVGQLRPTDPAIKAKYDADPDLPAINKRFGMLHGVSTSVNMVGLCFGVAYLWHLSGEFAIGK